MNVSAIITYKVINPMAFLFNVDQAIHYIKDQGSEVLKKVMSKFNYMSNDPNEPTLLDDTMIIGKDFRSVFCYKKCGRFPLLFPKRLINRPSYEGTSSNQNQGGRN